MDSTIICTNEVLDDMIKDLKKCRGDSEKSRPMSLEENCKLKPHQPLAIEWMGKKEEHSTRGGILADDMGLGKTVEVLCHIMKTKEDRGERKAKTLLVVPVTLMDQWSNAIADWAQSSTLIHYIYYTPNKGLPGIKTIEKDFDVIITNYDSLSRNMKDQEASEKKREIQKCPLFDIHWTRVILDEAQVIKNPKSQVLKAICQLKSKYKWCVTGTPISNNLLDLFCLYKFLKVPEFDNQTFWEEKFGSGVDLREQDRDRMHKLLLATMLMRTKKGLHPNLQLPEKTEHVVEVPLDSKEQELYLLIEKLIQDKKTNMQKDKQTNQEKKKKTNFNNGYANILLKRQAVTHPHLLDTTSVNGADYDQITSEDAEINKDLPFEWDGVRKSAMKHFKEKLGRDLFKKDYESSKMKMLLDLLMEKVLPRGNKAVIVSQWTSHMKILEGALDSEKYPSRSIHGKTNLNKRKQYCNEFNDLESEDVKVIFLQMGVGGYGLNLTGGNYMFIMDLHWNPQLLKQVYDRIYRIGQDKPVFIYTFISKLQPDSGNKTIDHYILDTQAKKIKLWDEIFSYPQITPQQGWTLNQDKLNEAIMLNDSERNKLSG